MPPKKASAKRSGKSDDFDALLAEAVKTTTATSSSKKEKSGGAEGGSNKAAGPQQQQQEAHLPQRPAIPHVESSADHPENRFRMPAAEGLPRQTWPEPTVPIYSLYRGENDLVVPFPMGVHTPYTTTTTATATATRADKDEGNAKDEGAAEGRTCSKKAGEEVGCIDLPREPTAAERRAVARERNMAGMLEDLRAAAEVHRHVRTYAMNCLIHDGAPLITIADGIEAKLEELIGKNTATIKDPSLLRKRGQAFPTGLSLNHIAAHFTPNGPASGVAGGDEGIVLTYDDVLKIDFGTQINGRIIDSAWTVALDKGGKYDPLLNAVRAATNEGVRLAGVDVRIADVSAAIQEVMESYEIELDGKTHQVRPIRNLNGHSIDQYYIHGGKSVPIVAPKAYKASPSSYSAEDEYYMSVKMEEGELFAIETFGSVNGRAYITEEGEGSHYMLDREMWAALGGNSEKVLKALIESPHYNLSPQQRLLADRYGMQGGAGIGGGAKPATGASSAFSNPKVKALLKHIEKYYGTLAFCRKWIERAGDKAVTNHGAALKTLCDVGLVISCPPLCDVKGSYTAQYEHTFVLKPTGKEVLSVGDDY